MVKRLNFERIIGNITIPENIEAISLRARTFGSFVSEALKRGIH